MPLNISPATFTGLGVIVGYLLINELTPAEQAAVGSWLNLVGDMLATNAGWIGVIEEQQAMMEEQNNTTQKDSDDNQEEQKTDTDIIYKAISKMKKDIEALQQNTQQQDDL